MRAHEQMQPISKRGFHLFPPPALAGLLFVSAGLCIYCCAIALSLVRLVVAQTPEAEKLVATLLWWSGLPSTMGLLLIALDLFVLLPRKRRHERRTEPVSDSPAQFVVALM